MRIRNKTVFKNIRTRLLCAIFVMLLCSFSLFGIVFNIVMRGHIKESADKQLDESYTAVMKALTLMDRSLTQLSEPVADWITNHIVETGGAQRVDVNMFVLDPNYQVLDLRELASESQKIIQELRTNERISLEKLEQKKIHTGDGEVYYVRAYTLPVAAGEEAAYWIIYADVSRLTEFSNVVNASLIILICMMSVIALLVSFLLSNSITEPIRKLSMLAADIGRGVFVPHDFKFKDSELDELNRELNRSAKQLETYDSEQKVFFQNVSHELRTPLMAIQCNAEGIAHGLMNVKQASEIILQETDRLTEMVKDLLYISKIDNITTSYVATKTDLCETLRTCARRQQAVADRKGVHVAFYFEEEPIYCECVGELISRAVENLVSNAIRYAEGQILLSCNRVAGRINISVSDDGPGIEEGSLPHIFERFYKGAGGNHGIGLSIVKSIVRQHGGNVAAQNKSEGGAVFSIMLLVRR